MSNLTDFLPTYGVLPMTLLSDQTLGGNAASVTFSAIPALYKDLWLEWEARHDTATEVEFYANFNGDASALYNFYVENRFGTANSTVQTKGRVGSLATSALTAGVYSTGTCDFFNYTAARFKHWMARGYYPTGAFEDRVSGSYMSNTAISSIVLVPLNNNFATGSRFRLWGRGG